MVRFAQKRISTNNLHKQPPQKTTPTNNLHKRQLPQKKGGGVRGNRRFPGIPGFIDTNSAT